MDTEINAEGLLRTITNIFGDLDPDVPKFTTDDPTATLSYYDRGDISYLVRTIPLRMEGDSLFKQKKYGAAIGKYKEAAQVIVGEGFQIPLYSGEGGGMRSQKYVDMEVAKKISLMGCCHDIAKCLVKLNKDEEALNWLEEVDVLYKNALFAQPKPTFEWFNLKFQSNDFFLHKVGALSLAGDIFLKLGNTGAAVHRKWNCGTSSASLPPGIDEAPIKAIAPIDVVHEITKLRHPDPKSYLKMEVRFEGLQVRGSWQKVELRKSQSIQPRFAFASFVWRSRLYISGGQRTSIGPWFRDIQYIDLNRLDGWHTLPPNPYCATESVTGGFACALMGVHNDKAYLFSGRRRLDYFDLIAQKWGRITTTWEGRATWPFLKNDLVDFALQVVDGKMFVFGGTHGMSAVGCNVFMVLDLETRIWRKLSGHAGPLVPDFLCPGPRRHPAMWVDRQKERIHLMYGEADRQGAQFHSEAHAADDGHGHDDLWSWHIKDEKWRRERITGNPPCPRSEMACTYNPVLDKVVMFGGYSPCIPSTCDDDKVSFTFSYYADTFIFDFSCSPPKWKQVITRGFPTYRAQSRLISDPDTGKTFLFGGYTNSQFVPDKKNVISRSFGDLWQLRLDVPCGYFEGVDMEEESRTAKAGPWQICYNCGNVGPWKKCGGSCKGRVFFCDQQCLKEGWKEHKERHHCAKK